MSKASLSTAEIEEEIINHDLIISGGVEDGNSLQDMNLEEKRELLKGINKSKEESHNEPVKSPSALDSSNFPALSTPGKSGVNQRCQKPGLKLPRRLSSGVNTNTGGGGIINLLDEDDDEPKANKFCLPGTLRDDAPPLKMPERPLLKVDNPMYRMEGESLNACLRRMLQAHEAWKRAYDTEMRKIESHGLTEDLEDEEEKATTPRKEMASDVYDFHSDSPLQVSKMYAGAKSKNASAGAAAGQRRTSRDSDYEVDAILKPEDSKMGDWITASSNRQRKKRNVKHVLGEPVTERDNTPDIDFAFEEKWDSRSTQWQPKSGSASRQSPALNNSATNRRSMGRSPLVEEEKVECPMCQKAFPLSKVENHAANCEGDPMDVEEGS